MTGTVSAPEPTPRIGLLAIIRKRRGIINEVQEFDGEVGRSHLVHIDYKDDQQPPREQIIWELEKNKHLLEPNEIPRSSDPPMRLTDFDALVRAARWTSISPFVDPDDKGPLDRMPISSPFHAAVQVENFQLIPLLKALRMPRVNLMVADDVGLGKTIECGLILSELLIRRRINRILILTPASLCVQWQDEMQSKFSLSFDVIDRDITTKIKRTFGIDANPWRCCSRIIASYHYLRQPDVLEQFRSTCRSPEGSPQLPWDLLVVDEVHNLMPASLGEDSQLCDMLRTIAPQFEHRLFLTATPHNGHTRSFSGLLELLDPVRFTRTDELKPAEKERIKQVVIRRLKREVNERTNPPRFCKRNPPEAKVLTFSKDELELIQAFEAFRTKVRSIIAGASKSRRIAGKFAIEILAKRLLSGPVTFADSWYRCKLGMQEEDSANDKDVLAAERTVKEETADDREAQQRACAAVSVVGSWMKSLKDAAASEIARIDRAVGGVGIRLEDKLIEHNPACDARFDALVSLIQQQLRDGKQWRADERLVVFTEYKTTLDYLLRRLRELFRGEEDRFLCLFGGMDSLQREQIKDAFNDPDNKVRVLVATDAASEGLNLQSTARYLLHYDCPWNPSRVEQRNGRLDRHGQARDVSIFHFASEQDADLKFMDYLIKKVDHIREDLGSIGELFDEATHQRLIEGRDVYEVQKTLDIELKRTQGNTSIAADNTVNDPAVLGDDATEGKLQCLAEEMDYDPVAAHAFLDTAMTLDVGKSSLTAPDAQDRFKINNPDLPTWKDTIDETLRKKTGVNTLGPLPWLTFSAKPFITYIGPRPVFRPKVDTLMLHLGHPMTRKAVGTLTRKRFPGPQAVSRWTVRYGEVPAGAEALILLHVEELAVNELRETFHQWVRTIQLPVVRGSLQNPLPHTAAIKLRQCRACHDEAILRKGTELLDEFEPDLKKLVKKLRESLTQKIRQQLEIDGKNARDDEDKRYQSRQGEVSTLIAENTLAKLERQITELKEERTGTLFALHDQDYLDDLDRSIQLKQEELDRRKRHYEEVREQLARERERIVKFLLPKRYSLQGDAQVFPVAVEIRFPMPRGN